MSISDLIRRIPAAGRHEHTVDMTNGDPLRLILTFAIPLLIGTIFQQVYNVVDTMVAGYCLGDTAIAAIGATGSLYGLMINLSWGLNSGFALVVTRCFGARDMSKLRKTVAATFILGFGISVFTTFMALVFLRPLMNILHTPESIFDQAYSYMIVICGGLLATVIYNTFAAIMRSFGNSRTPLYVLIFSSLLNIGLDLLFVAQMDMGGWQALLWQRYFRRQYQAFFAVYMFFAIMGSICLDGWTIGWKARWLGKCYPAALRWLLCTASSALAV